MGRKWKKGQGSSVSSIGDDEARLRLRREFLMQDYKQLWMEIEAKKKRLMILMKKKFELLAETKFLRRKRKSFSDNQCRTRPFKLKRRYSDDMLSTLHSLILEEHGNLKDDFLDEIQEERESKNSHNDDDDDDDDDDGNEAMGSNMPPGLYLANGNNEISVKEARLLKFRDTKKGANRVKWRNPIVSKIHHLPLH
ncbi:hypothetical protein M5K25_026768 [Dendrobium thyrsiflorum]|uniref:Uncharacterized protein n=1 Tax=Dendrobium thyrsiflorum TaxID=117978 RepID=A0ABD0TY34_DENTH